MTWSTTLVADLPIVETTFAGIVLEPELLEAVQSSLRLAVEHQTRDFLADCRALSAGHSVFDLYEIGEAIDRGEPRERMVEALLLPALPAPAENVQFWETLGLNRGHGLRIFTDRDEALAWLADEARRATGREAQGR